MLYRAVLARAAVILALAIIQAFALPGISITITVIRHETLLELSFVPSRLTAWVRLQTL